MGPLPRLEGRWQLTADDDREPLVAEYVRVGGVHVQAVMPPRARGGFWHVTDTPYGTRLIVGDVVGGGFAAGRLSSQILASWRALAAHEPTIRGVALRLDTLVAEWGEPERFAPAVLMTVGSEAVCCGHPPPLRYRDGGALPCPLPPGPPLGLMAMAGTWAEAGELALQDGEELVLLGHGLDPPERPGLLIEQVTRSRGDALGLHVRREPG